VPVLRLLANVVVVLGALRLVSCGSSLVTPGVVPTDPRPTPANILPARNVAFRAGERMEIGFWLRSFPIGRASVTVGEPCGREAVAALVVRSTGSATGLLGPFDDASVDIGTLLDARTGLPIATRWSQQLDRLARYEVEYQPLRYWSRSAATSKPSSMRDRPTPSPAHDLHSAIGLVRAWDPQSQPRGHVYLVVGRALWRMELQFGGKESVSTALGVREAVRIDGAAQRLKRSFEPASSEPRAFALWISDDADRLPLRLAVESDVGEIQAEVLSYQRPRTDAPVVGAAAPPVPSAAGAASTAIATPGPALARPACPDAYQPSSAYQQALAQDAKPKRLLEQARRKKSAPWRLRFRGRRPARVPSAGVAGAPSTPPPDPSVWRSASPAGSTLAPTRPPP
jgi:hypothetical protein